MQELVRPQPLVHFPHGRGSIGSRGEQSAPVFLCLVERLEVRYADSRILLVEYPPVPSTKQEASTPVIDEAASINSNRTSIAAETAAFAFMNVTLLEYEPRSTGDVSTPLILSNHVHRKAQYFSDCLTDYRVGSLSDVCGTGMNRYSSVHVYLQMYCGMRKLVGIPVYWRPLPDMKNPHPTPFPFRAASF